MSQFEKFKARIMQVKPPKDIMPKELQKFMEKTGFILLGVTGSHFVYKHNKLRDNLSIPMAKPVKPIYIVKIREALIELGEGGL